MDLEGFDGRERGEDDTAFEKQSALFALAMSDIVLINMWCIEIGREQAANKPLLKTVFQVMLQLFSHRKTTLLFVIRDKTKTPLENLKHILSEDIQKIWDCVPKPQAHKDTPLSELFTVEVVALDSYEEKEEQFKEQVANLRQRFVHSIAPGGLAGDRRGAVPASGFSYSAQQIWKVIKENKDLDLPAHRVLVATARCEEIANESLALFSSDECWCRLDEAAQTSIVPGFGKELGSVLGKCLSRYDMEATYFDDGVRTAKRQQLESKLMQLVHPAYRAMMRNLRSKTLDEFKDSLTKALERGKGFADAACDCTQSIMSKFDFACKDATIEQANWDTLKAHNKLRRDIDAHVTSVRDAKLYELTFLYEKQLDKALGDVVYALLGEASENTWPAIRSLLQRETELAISGLSSALSLFDIDQVTIEKMLVNIENYARSLVESKAREESGREESGRVLMRMEDRFTKLFNYDSAFMARVWKSEKDIKAIARTACSASITLLSVMAAIRLDDYTDNIQNTLLLALMDSVEPGTNQSVDPLATSSWERVPLEKTLITPIECKSLWKQFNTETVDQAVTKAVTEAKAARKVCMLAAGVAAGVAGGVAAVGAVGVAAGGAAGVATGGAAGGAAGVAAGGAAGVFRGQALKFATSVATGVVAAAVANKELIMNFIFARHRQNFP